MLVAFSITDRGIVLFLFPVSFRKTSHLQGIWRLPSRGSAEILSLWLWSNPCASSGHLLLTLMSTGGVYHTNYFQLLGITPDASSSTIKAAFKRLALRSHPDVYHGADAEEQTRQLLLAYQTLSDPEARRAYDARCATLHSQQVEQQPERPARPPEGTWVHSGGSLRARRDRTRPYAFPTLGGDTPVRFTLGEATYDLSPREARTLQQGYLYGSVPEATVALAPQIRAATPHQCHRCHDRWVPAEGGPRRVRLWELICPACKANDWGTYVLLRCLHCQTVFESEQIREQFGPAAGKLFTPYELFPLCPCCGAARWCPAEEARLEALRSGVSRSTGEPGSRS